MREERFDEGKFQTLIQERTNLEHQKDKSQLISKII